MADKGEINGGDGETTKEDNNLYNKSGGDCDG